jgi:hypothetical protein
VSKINAFGAELARSVVAALDASVPGTGVFLDACAHHTAMGTEVWEGVRVGGVAMVDAVAEWLAQAFGPGGACGHALENAGCAPTAVDGGCDACRVAAGVAAGCTKAEVRRFCGDASSPGGRRWKRSVWIAEDAFPCTKCCGAYRPTPGF